MVDWLALLLCVQCVLHRVSAWRPSVLTQVFPRAQLKSPVTAGMGLWHLHPFVNSHFHYFTVVELATLQMSRQHAQTAFQHWPFTKISGVRRCTRVPARQDPSFYPDEIFVILCHDGTNAPLCSGILLTYSDTPLQ